MGCEKCVHFHSGYEGDYNSYPYVECNAEAKASNLKGFPFKNIPKSCRGTFSVNKEYLPNSSRHYYLLHSICDNICSRSDNKDIRYSKNEGCNPNSCDAFQYILGRTDVVGDMQICDNKELSEEQIRELLKGKKFKVRNKRMSVDFKVAIKEICPICKGEGILNNNMKNPLLCNNCNYGRITIKVDNP